MAQATMSGTAAYPVLRFFARLLAHSFYRLRVINREAVPASGGALIVANHLSFIDVVFISVASPRRVRFVTAREIYNIAWLRPFCRAAGAFPISSKDSPKELARTLLAVRAALEAGDLVCMFPEGGVSRTGNTLRFNRGIEFIMKGLAFPVIPAYLDRMWGSVWSFGRGRAAFKFPKSVPHPVTVVFGEPVPAGASVSDVRQKVLELSVSAFRHRLDSSLSLPEAFFNEVTRDPFGACIEDSGGLRFNRWQAFAAAYAVFRQLRALVGKEAHIGIWLPSSVASSVVNVAVGILGKPVVNLNYTASRDALLSAVEQGSLKQCITSRAFVERIGGQPPCVMIYWEDLLDGMGLRDRLAAFVLAVVLPSTVSHRIVFGSWQSRKNDDIVTIVFTSGSTGLPKGVMLMHRNVTANLEGFCQAFQVRRGDKIMGILPFFHSFGYTAVLWLPLITCASAIYHPSPMDAQVVGDLVRKHKATFLMATPTFISAYTKRCRADDLKTIRFTIIGAEKLKAVVAKAFAEKFGFYPLEGYGCTELSPIVSLNFPDYQAGDILQRSQKPGSIGRPLPGVAVRVVDPETFQTLKSYEEGLLLVKGGNVMKGYLNQPQRTHEAFVDGWYKTGDIAYLDEDGFIVITDRLNRFSKIAGEMIPHIRIEEAIHQAVNAAEQVCIVTAVPDDRRGERLVVLCLRPFDIPAVRASLKAAGLPNLWIPDAAAFVVIDAIPVLGSGKLDLAGVKTLARAFTS